MFRRVRLEENFGRIHWREALALMAMSWLVPALVHLAPSPGVRPLGVYLLPAFWTAFVAVYSYGIGVGVLVAFVTPVVTLLASGSPAYEWLGTMSLELLGFVVAAGWLVRRWPRFWLSAPLAYVLGKALAIAVQSVVPALSDARNPFVHLRDSVSSGVAGLGVLLLINLVLVKLAPGDLDWDGD